MKSIKKLKNHSLFFCRLVILPITLFACSSGPSVSSSSSQALNLENACDILNTNATWREAFENTFQKYDVPPHVVMAIIHQESRFIADARPPRQVVLGVPLARPSNAYGYAQALDETWDWYRDRTGNSGAERDNFSDAVDFIGWYIATNYRRTKVPKWNAKDQYLAYHEGSGGYLKKSHNNKPWLLAVSDKVARRASMYRQQLTSCYTYPVN